MSALAYDALAELDLPAPPMSADEMDAAQEWVATYGKPDARKTIFSSEPVVEAMPSWRFEIAYENGSPFQRFKRSVAREVWLTAKWDGPLEPHRRGCVIASVLTKSPDAPFAIKRVERSLDQLNKAVDALADPEYRAPFYVRVWRRFR